MVGEKYMDGREARIGVHEMGNLRALVKKVLRLCVEGHITLSPYAAQSGVMSQLEAALDNDSATVAEVDDEGTLLVDGDPVGQLFGDGTPLYVAPGSKVRMEIEEK